MECKKCGWHMVLDFVENGEHVKTKIWRCTNLRCGYMCREVTLK